MKDKDKPEELHEEIELSADDEAALDAAWAEIHAQIRADKNQSDGDTKER